MKIFASNPGLANDRYSRASIRDLPRLGIEGGTANAILCPDIAGLRQVESVQMCSRFTGFQFFSWLHGASRLSCDPAVDPDCPTQARPVT